MHDRGSGGLRHVLFGGGHGAVRNDGAMQRHQRAANLCIRRRVDLTSFDIAKEIIHHVKGALAIIGTGGAVAEMFGSGVQRRLVEIKSIVGGRLGCIVATGMATLMRECGLISSHLTVVVIVAGRA